jgi:hypothetical protein
MDTRSATDTLSVPRRAMPECMWALTSQSEEIVICYARPHAAVVRHFGCGASRRGMNCACPILWRGSIGSGKIFGLNTIASLRERLFQLREVNVHLGGSGLWMCQGFGNVYERVVDRLARCLDGTRSHMGVYRENRCAF